MGLSEYVYNVGEIVLQKDECFWIFPSEYISDERNICSPWFSYIGEKWCLVKQRHHNSGTKGFIFHLWRKVCSSPPKYEYTIKLSLKTTCNRLVNIAGDINPEYGCELKFNYTCLCSYYHLLPAHIFSQNGLVKLFFSLKKKENIINATKAMLNPLLLSDEETSDEDEESSEGEENYENEEDSINEDKESSEDEENSDDESTNKTKTAGAEGIRRLAENFKQVFLDGRLTDAVLKVDSHEFNVHRIVLVARSPVFASMFEHDLAEKNTNEVDIPDCTAESFEVFLHYLYSGSAETLSISNVYNVYYAADKYHIDDLKELCVEFMKKNLSIETFCDIIALSLHHGESKLQKAATQFFCKKIKKIIKTVPWQKYLKENSTQANELLIKALKA